MKQEQKRIEELKSNISYIEFADRLTSEDYQKIRKMEEEIKELEKQITDGVALYIEDNSNNIETKFFLTANCSLCCGDKPTWFDSEEEAKEYFNKAEIKDKENCKLKFIKKEDYNNETIH